MTTLSLSAETITSVLPNSPVRAQQCVDAFDAMVPEQPELPALEGTPKQIAWAEDLRTWFVATLKVRYGIEALPQEDSWGEQEMIGVERAFTLLAGVTSASAWINVLRMNGDPVMLKPFRMTKGMFVGLCRQCGIDA